MIILMGMIFLMVGIAMTEQMTLIGQKPKDKRPGWACQLLGVAMIYHGWIDMSNPLIHTLWNIQP